MTSVLSAAAVLVGLVVVYRIALSTGAAWMPFRPARARTSVRRPAGGNALVLLAVVNVATLGYQIAMLSAVGGPDTVALAAVLLPALLLVAVAALVLARSVTDAILGGVGAAAALAGAYLDNGVAGVVVIVVLSALLLFLLGTFRGILNPRRGR